MVSFAEFALGGAALTHSKANKICWGAFRKRTRVGGNCSFTDDGLFHPSWDHRRLHLLPQSGIDLLIKFQTRMHKSKMSAYPRMLM